ncbi:MAG: Acetone carboxylase gamma subunit, partial [Pseudomonadota bacterium]
ACRTDLGLISTNYKLACRRYDALIQSANPNIGDWRRYIDDEPVFRQFFCPGCGRLIENEIARKSDELLHDIELITK